MVGFKGSLCVNDVSFDKHSVLAATVIYEVSQYRKRVRPHKNINLNSKTFYLWLNDALKIAVRPVVPCLLT